jgi:hypothetical protein
MSGNGSTFSEFKPDAVLPTPVVSATSSGEIVNNMKSTEMPPAQSNPYTPMAGGKKRKSSKKSRQSRRKSANKKSRRNKRGGKK